MHINGKAKILEQGQVIGIEPDAEVIDPHPRMRPGILRSFRQRFMRSTMLRQNILLFAANMATSVFNFLYHPIIGHLLGAEKYGTIVSFGAFGLVLTLPTLVIPSIFNKFTADLVAQGRLGNVNYLFRRVTRYALFAGVICVALFITISPTLTRIFRMPPHYVFLFSLGFVLTFAAPVTVGMIQGRQQFAWFALLNFLSATLRVITTTVALVLGFGINGALVAGLISGVLIYLLSLLPLRDVLQAPTERILSLKPLFNYSLGAGLALGGSMLLTNIDTALATPFLSPRDAGYYDALATMGRIVLFVGGSFVWVMFPKVAALQQLGKSHGAILAWTMAGVSTVSAIVVVIFGLFPSQVVTLIFHEPPAVAQQLFWYGVSMLFLASANVLIYYFLSLGYMAFVPILLACCALQFALIIVWHGSIAQMVTIMVTVMALLFSSLVALYIWQSTQVRQKGREAQVA